MFRRIAKQVTAFKKGLSSFENKNARLCCFIAVMLVVFLSGCGTHVTPPVGSAAAKMEGVWKWLNAEKANELSNGTEYKLYLEYGHRNKKDAPLVLMPSLWVEEKLTAKGRAVLALFGRVGAAEGVPTRYPLPDLTITGNEASGDEPRIIGANMFCSVVLDGKDPDVLYLSTDVLNPKEPWDKKKFARLR